MKAIFKIEEYLQDRNSIVVKICRLHSHIPIDETSAKIVDCELLDLRDTDCFIDSLMKRSASRFIERQDEKQDILDENKPRASAGVGISWLSPFGPVKFYLSKAILKEKYDKN